MDLPNKELEKIINKNIKNELDKASIFVHNSYDKFKLYFTEFKKTFKLDLEKCKKGELQENNRDLFWFLCLDILPFNNAESWKQILTDLRGDYLSLKLSIITKEIDEFILLEEKKGGDKYEEFRTKINEDDYETLDLINYYINFILF